MDVFMGYSGCEGRVFPDINILDSLLRILYSYLLVEDKGFLIHSSASEGKLYTGPAGSGKTTSVKDNKVILSDDVVGLRKGNEKWFMCSTPFTGEYEGGIPQRKEELKQILVLTRPRKSIKPGSLFSDLLKNIIYFFPGNKAMEKITGFCQDIAYNVKGYGYKNK